MVSLHDHWHIISTVDRSPHPAATAATDHAVDAGQRPGLVASRAVSQAAWADPWTYLKDVLERLLTNHRIDELLLQRGAWRRTGLVETVRQAADGLAVTRGPSPLELHERKPR